MGLCVLVGFWFTAHPGHRLSGIGNASPACASPLPAGTRKHYVLDGQHQVLAAQRIREELEAARREVPQWLKQFRCTQIKSEVDKDTREIIGGRQQARQAALLQQGMGQTCKRILIELNTVREAAVAAGRPVQFNLSQILEKTWDKTGRSATRDGSLVCGPGAGGGGRGKADRVGA